MILATMAERFRRILDDGGLREVKIFASGNLDESDLHNPTAGGTPIDGIGSNLVISADALRAWQARSTRGVYSV